jgi:hypothetical protein
VDPEAIISDPQQRSERWRRLRSSKLGIARLRLVHLSKDHEDTQGGLVDAYVHAREDGKPFPTWLAVANKTNKGMQEIFAGSSWPGGVWTQALAGIDGAWLNKKSRFGGGAPRAACWFPLDAVIDVEAALRKRAAKGRSRRTAAGPARLAAWLIEVGEAHQRAHFDRRHVSPAGMGWLRRVRRVG